MHAFWSLTMYDDRQLFVDNPLNRYAIGDRDPLVADPDGGLELLIGHQPPARHGRVDRLPARAVPFNVVMRLYWPPPQVLDGTWVPPPVQRLD